MFKISQPFILYHLSCLKIYYEVFYDSAFDNFSLFKQQQQ